MRFNELKRTEVKKMHDREAEKGVCFSRRSTVLL